MLEGASRLSVRAISWGGLNHPPQPVGRAFSPEQQRGYFNDLTAKATVSRGADAEGLPVSRVPRRPFFYHPVDVCQYALGCYDKWILREMPDGLEAFLKGARWLVKFQDPAGGWPCFRHQSEPPGNGFSIGIPAGWHSASGIYSGMVQGQALSVLTRAHGVTQSYDYQIAAEKAFTLIRRDTSRGGVCDTRGGQVSIEEVPSNPRNTILNGWIFGMFGVWDLWLSAGLKEARDFFEANHSSMVRRAESFDLGWWSSYDESGHIAKPFYHQLHIAELTALNLVAPEKRLEELVDGWKRRLGRSSQAKAQLAYLLQKVVSPVKHQPFAVSGSRRKA